MYCIAADSDADADPDRDVRAAEIERLPEQRQHAVGQNGRVGPLIDTGLYNRELVAAEPCNGIVFAHRVLDPVGNADEQLITRLMTEIVVDRLELVQVEIMHRHQALPSYLRHCGLQTVVEKHAVRQVGQRIVMRHMGDQLLIAPLLGHVEIGCHEAAAVERHAAHFQNDAVGPRPVVAMRLHLARQFHPAPDVHLDVAGTVFPAQRIEAEELFHRRIAVGHQLIRIFQQNLLLLVAQHHLQIVVE